MKSDPTKLWLGAALVLVGPGLLATACSSSPATKTSPSGGTESDDAGGGPSTALGQGDGGDAGDDGATGPQTFVRVAHVSPDSPPIDVCVAPHGTTAFQGPLIAQLAASLDDGGVDDAAAAGLTYGEVSAYIPLAPGQYDVFLVAAGASSCTSPFFLVHRLDVGDGGEDASSPDASVVTDAGPSDAGQDASAPASEWTNLPSLTSSTYATLLVAGDRSTAGGDAPLTVTILPDDAMLAGGAAVLRAINAIPSSPALDFGLSSISQWMPLLTDVRFAAASTQAGAGDGTVDANGYVPIAPLLDQAMSARPSSSDGGVALAAATSVEIDQGSIATVIAIGGKTGDVANPPALLLCVDNQPSGGLLSDCSVAK